MPSDNLLLEISPALLEAVDLTGHSGKVDYFRLLGISPRTYTAADVDKAVMARSKALRAWQNSPQHGPEVVRLLPMLHRIAAILKDPVRGAAYRKEIERILKGETVDPLVEYGEMARAALADGTLDQASRAELLRFAAAQNIPAAEAGRILNEIAAAAPKQPAANRDPSQAWEFSLAGGKTGPDAFRNAISAVLEGGAFNVDYSARAARDAANFGIQLSDARAIIDDLVCTRFRGIVEKVARGGALNDNQARLLMPKAAGLGLDPTKAYEILSAFTFTGASQADIATLHLTHSSFDSADIEDLLAMQTTLIFRKRGNLLARLIASMSAPVKVAAGIAAVVAVVYYGRFLLPSPGAAREKAAREAAWNAQREAAQVPTATPGPWDAPRPDPPSGLLTVEAERPDDPPSFEIKITEVTCAEYQKFLTAMLHPNRPEGWGIDYSFPAGSDNQPARGLAAPDAEAFCKWKARRMKLPSTAVRLPSVAEYRRLLREQIRGGGRPSETGSWVIEGFSKLGGLGAVTEHKRLDTLYLPAGQVYDLCGNVAEWGMDEKDGLRAVLGGDFQVKDERFNLMNPRYQDPAKPSENIGFRYVVTRQK